MTLLGPFLALSALLAVGQFVSIVSLYVLHRTAQARSEPANRLIAAERRTSIYGPTMVVQDARIARLAISLGGRAARLGRWACIGMALSLVGLVGMLVLAVVSISRDYLAVCCQV